VRPALRPDGCDAADPAFALQVGAFCTIADGIPGFHPVSRGERLPEQPEVSAVRSASEDYWSGTPAVGQFTPKLSFRLTKMFSSA
jgi:hypothetical protein